MPDPRAADRQEATLAGRAAGALAAILLRPVWLPRAAYAAVPWVYLATGSAALAGGLYLPDTSWYLPYLVLAGVGLLRLAVAVASLRRRLTTKREPHYA